MEDAGHNKDVITKERTIGVNLMKERKTVFGQLKPTEDNLKKSGFRRDCALLKRAVGRPIQSVDANTLAAFYSRVPLRYKEGDKDRCLNEEKAFYIACLYCLQGGNGKAELPAAWASYAVKHKVDHTTITRLVDQPWNDNVAQSLVRIVRRMMSDGYSIDLEALMYDVTFWNTWLTRKHWAENISKTKEKENEN